MLELRDEERGPPVLLWLSVRDLVSLPSSASYKLLLPNPAPRNAIAWPKNTFLTLASAIEPVTILLAVSENENSRTY